MSRGPPQPLPIDPVLPAILASIERAGAVVVSAEPGAGKTTRVPPALAAARPGEVLVLEPRRLAARLAARRVADERGEAVGETVGYHVRFDEVAGPRTRIRFLTEGLLVRRLLSDPSLRGVGAVVLDEFHERHLHGDLALALLARRPELALCVMSATLDAEPLARFLGAEVVSAPGRRFEVAIEHLDPPRAARDALPLERQVAQALRRLLADGLDGDVLVFLPGAAEIRRAAAACAELARANAIELTPLHGDLPAAEQDRAIAPGPRRKLILSTNVAETSLTIEGVVAVIDSGLARVARHSPWSGLPGLSTEKISRASATQRAGRAGRLKPGRCLRLYTRADHDGRPPHEIPEIRRADLAETVLLLRARGLPPLELAWLEAPPRAAVEAAETLLGRLGAIDPAGAVTAMGERMLAVPAHPRLARLAIEAAARGIADRGALAAALLGERDVLLAARVRPFASGRSRRDESGASDLLARVELVESARGDDERLDRGALAAVRRARDAIARAIGRGRGDASERGPRTSDLGRASRSEEALGIAALAGFPDRLARRRQAHGDALILAGGGVARLDESSVVREAALLVALDADEGPGGARVRIASAVEPEWLIELFPEAIEERTSARFDPAAERVEVATGLAWDGLILEETRRSDVISPEVSRVLAEAALAAGPERYAEPGEPGEIERLRARLAFARELGGDSTLPILDGKTVRETLTALCAGRRSFAELRGALYPALVEAIAPAGRAALARIAPERIALPGGRTVRVEYSDGRPPWIESRLQDFFGLSDGPRLCGGRVALVLHLLAPNQRAVQVTTDLAGFWERHYPSLRRQLMRRYPKHAWPEDPLAAAPPRPRTR